MTLQELQTQFIALADDPSITNAQAGIWINSFYKLLCKEYDWSFMVGSGSYTVTSGTTEMLFSAFSTPVTDFAKPLRVWTSSSSTSDKTLLRPMRYEDRNIPGISGYYITPDRLSIGILPTPSNSTEVITIDYLKSLDDMADGDEPIFLRDFHFILVFKALVMYQKQQREASDEFEIPYQEILAQMISFYKLPQVGTNPILDRGGSSTGLPYNSPFKV